MKILKKIALLLLVILVGMQFYRPDKNQTQGDHTAEFITETNPPEDVKTILQQTCYDCHSNNTEYPWYNNIAPISYWLSDHVKDGKKHLKQGQPGKMSAGEYDQVAKDLTNFMVYVGEPAQLHRTFYGILTLLFLLVLLVLSYFLKKEFWKDIH